MLLSTTGVFIKIGNLETGTQRRTHVKTDAGPERCFYREECRRLPRKTPRN